MESGIEEKRIASMESGQDKITVYTMIQRANATFGSSCPTRAQIIALNPPLDLWDRAGKIFPNPGSMPWKSANRQFPLAIRLPTRAIFIGNTNSKEASF